jgi:hypothetical protein
MNTIPGAPIRGRGFTAAVAATAFLWSLALGVSPQLHERIHPDANQPDHACAVTVMAAGNYTHSAPAPLVSVPVPLVHFSIIPALAPQWVESPFLSARIFEHAPPALA